MKHKQRLQAYVPEPLTKGELDAIRARVKQDQVMRGYGRSRDGLIVSRVKKAHGWNPHRMVK